MAYYGTINGANAYFDQRLHSGDWLGSNADDRPKALTEATRIIDALDYRGVKHAVWLITYEWDANADRYERILIDAPNRDAIITADATQELLFPRGQDDTVPQEIEWACYEIAYSLLEGFDPEDAIDRQNVQRQAYSVARTTYNSDSPATEYLGYGIPTAKVWRWLKPRLKLDQQIRTSRAN